MRRTFLRLAVPLALAAALTATAYLPAPAAEAHPAVVASPAAASPAALAGRGPENVNWGDSTRQADSALAAGGYALATPRPR
ncbi:hypothetical protein [Streptomyces sp. NPDC001594]|uniref:hypothetical protein n=1 Tax=Streptomyces sp. NPDC001594 TaxID=3364590 RepID=UPI00369DDCE1